MLQEQSTSCFECHLKVFLDHFQNELDSYSVNIL